MNMDDQTAKAAGAPGWDAIDTALRVIYGDQVPRHYGTLLSYRLGGPDPLDGISAYARTAPFPHWHFITFGFSELYEKETENPLPEQSGYGFELTMRLTRDLADTEPPMWALNFLQNLARYVFQSGNVFQAGDHMDLNGPIAIGQATAITTMAIQADPELTEIQTPNGSLSFLQVVGLTADEYAAVLAWNTKRFLEVAGRQLPLGQIDLARSSLLKIPSFLKEVTEGTERDGSSTGRLFVDKAEFEIRRSFLRQPTVEIRLGTIVVEKMAAILPARIQHGRGFGLAMAKASIEFEPGTEAKWSLETPDRLIVHLPLGTAVELSKRLLSRASSFAIPGLPQVSITVIPSIIRDRDGHAVRTIE